MPGVFPARCFLLTCILFSRVGSELELSCEEGWDSKASCFLVRGVARGVARTSGSPDEDFLSDGEPVPSLEPAGEEGARNASRQEEHPTTHASEPSHGDGQRPDEHGEHGDEHGGKRGDKQGGEHGQGHGDPGGQHPEHAEGHGAYTAADVAAGACFVGFILIVMSALFMTKNSDKDIQAAAFTMVSQIISIFCAVLLHSNLCMLIDAALGSDDKVVVIRLALFLVLLAAVFFDVARLNDKVSLAATGTLGGHLVGFAALETFGTVQRLDPFKQHALLTLMVSAVIYHVFLHSSRVFAGWMMRYTETEQSAMESRGKAIAECQQDAYCFCVGFLLTECVKFKVLGFFSPVHGNPVGHTQAQVESLVWYCAGYIVFIMVLSPVHRLARRRRAENVAWFLFLALHTVMMAAAWMCVFIGEWEWFVVIDTSSRSSGIMLMTFLSTMFAFGIIFVLDFIADHGLMPPSSVRAVISVTATAVGLSWEKAFREAEHALTSLLPYPLNLSVRTLLIVLILSIVIFTWRYFILPEAIEYAEEVEEEEEEEESKPAEVAAAVS